jgi:hypothetical protein
MTGAHTPSPSEFLHGATSVPQKGKKNMEDNSHCNSRLVYHYTVGGNFTRILASGVILPATEGLLPSQRPVVWFSTNPLWENTVVKGIPVVGGGYVNIGWAEFNHNGIPLIRIAIASVLVRVAKMEYAQSDEWRGTFAPVPVEKWVTVETYNVQAMRWQEHHEQPSFGRAA